MKTLLTVTFTLSAMIFSALASAAPADESAPATIVVYRADESFKTERLGLDVHVDETSLARLTSEESIVASGAPGTYVLDTSIPGSIPLALELKPGATHYVHTRLKMYGNRVVVELVEVEEQVARTQLPEDTNALMAI